MSSAAWRFAFRILVSAVLAGLPAYALFVLLRFTSALIGLDLVKVTIDTLLGTELGILTALGDYIVLHPAWAPTLIIWAAVTLTIFRKLSKRIEFFVVSGQDFKAMQAPPGTRGHDGIVPWVEVQQLVTPSDKTLPLRRYKTWDDQHVALEQLATWAKSNPGGRFWGFWPRKPKTQPLKLALITGANGIGKSSLGAALGNRLLTEHLTDKMKAGAIGEDSIHQRRPLTVRTALPWFRWDVGVLMPVSVDQLVALKIWEPRRPTLLIVDEPNDDTSEVLKILAERRQVFWHPVRVLVIDQMFPSALDDYLPLPTNEATSAVPLLYSEALRLGEVYFDVRAVRVMWFALCKEQRNLTTAQPRDFNAISSKLRSTDQFSLLLNQTGPNPLHIALALTELVNTDQTVLDMCKASNNDPTSAALLEEVELLKVNNATPTPFCHRQISARADDLVKTYDSILQQHAPELRYEVMLAIATATVVGGLTLPEHLSKRLKASTLEQMFPGGGYLHSSQDAWIPPVRPTVVARVFLETWINASAAPEAVASDIATAAWQHNAAGAMRALLRGHHLPDQLRSVLETAGNTQDQRLPWAQGCCIALLSDDAPADRFVAALDRLDTEESRSFERWLQIRLSALHPQRPHPVCVLIVLSHSVARRCAETTRAPSLAELEVAFKTLTHWSVLAGDTRRHRISRQRELARAVVTLMKSVTAWGETEAQGTRQIVEPLLVEYFNKGRRVNLAICRFFTRQGKSVNHQHPHLAGGIENVTAAKNQVLIHYFACLAACALGGKPALMLSKGLARRIEAIVATLPECAADARLQELRAGSWRWATLAASLLGGRRALALSKTLAWHVEWIVTSHTDFATDVQLQEQRASTWVSVTFAASELMGKQGLMLSKSLARHVEAITTARADFAADTRLQARRANAWQFVTCAACILGGRRALRLSNVLARHIETIVTNHPDFATVTTLQEHRIGAWSSVTFAASQLGGMRALTLSTTLARHIEKIVTDQADFATDARLQELHAAAWSFVMFAAFALEGMRALTLTNALARRVETITAQADFAFAVGLQQQRADAWRGVAFAASQLGGKRALTHSIAHAQYVESITTAQADFANDFLLQRQRASAWASTTLAASQIREERALPLSKSLAKRVELIVTAHSDFTTDVSLQEHRARAWRYVSSAASRLTGRTALKLSKSLARRVECIVTARDDFATVSALQLQRAGAWHSVMYAASQLGGMRALTLSTILARHIEKIVTDQADFATDGSLQELRAHAWALVTFAASQLRDKRALELSILYAKCVENIATAKTSFAADAFMQKRRASAWRYVTYIASRPGVEEGYNTAINTGLFVRNIVFARRWSNPEPLALEWRYTQEYLSAIGIILEGPDIEGPEP